MIGREVSHYRITSKLGSGGHGRRLRGGGHASSAATWRSSSCPRRWPRTRHSLERFQREARAASALNHPGICTVHAIDAARGAALHRHGAARGRDARASGSARGRSTRRAPRPRDPDRGRPRVGALEGDRPPRPEAREPLRDAARAGEDPRLRPRQDRAGAAGGRRRALRGADRGAAERAHRPRARRWGRCPTCRPSRRAGSSPTRGPTSSRWGRCSTRWPPATCRSRARPRRSCSRPS